MFCFIALLVLSVLGIFSATHRKLAKEAFDCVFRRITFRPCTADFREKIKGKIIARLIDRRPLLAKIFNKHFEMFAWIFFILMLASTIWTVRGGYNYYIYGNCQGENKDGFCLFDPTGHNNKVSSVEETCSLEPPSKENLNIDQINFQNYPRIENESNKELIFIGCYACEYSRQAFPNIKKLVEKEKPNFTFIHFPVKNESTKITEYDYCAFTLDKSKYWKYNELLFASEIEKYKDESFLKDLAVQSGYNQEEIKVCANSDETSGAVFRQFQEIKTTGVYGTPTVFINGKPLVGPKPYRVYKRQLK